MHATGMGIICAIGSSLFAVGAFGLTVATNHALSGLVDWPVTGEFIAGGVAGGWPGALGAKQLVKTRRVLNLIFALAILALVKSLRAWPGGHRRASAWRASQCRLREMGVPDDFRVAQRDLQRAGVGAAEAGASPAD